LHDVAFLIRKHNILDIPCKRASGQVAVDQRLDQLGRKFHRYSLRALG
jgi:hypothetical protein